MRNLLLVCAGLVVVLGIVSGNLWRELRSDRQMIAGMQAQMAQARLADIESARTQAAPIAVQAKPATIAPVQIPAPVAQAVQPAPVPPPVNRDSPALTEEVRHAAAILDSDETAARVKVWKDRMTSAGETLTAAQFQALNTAATNELRRETEEKLSMEKENGAAEPKDAEAEARLKEDNINRQNDTNMRILRDVTADFTPDESNALRTIFEAGDAARRADARAAREQAATR